MSEFFTGLSDFFANNWGQLVAIFTSSTLLPTLASCIFKAFITKSHNKSIKNLISKVDEKFESIEIELVALEDKYKNMSKEHLDEFKKALKEFAEQYSSAKKQLCEKIVAGKEKVKEVLAEADKLATEFEEKIEEIQEQTPIIEEEPVVEEVQEDVVEVVEETPKTDVKVAKRVIVEG